MALNSQNRELIRLLPGEIVCPLDWNCRKEYAQESEPSQGPNEALTDAEFEASILEHGVETPPLLRIVDGSYTCVVGFRRVLTAVKVAPDREIECLLDRSIDEQSARFANLNENLHRKDLRPWEVAEALYTIKVEHEELTIAQISEQTGLTVSYVGNLIRMRRKAHDQVWAQFKRWGVSMRIPYHEVLQIVKLPKSEQLAAWNEALAARKSKVGKRGKEKKPGPMKLKKYLSGVGTLKGSSEFRRGLKLGLQIALGDKPYPKH